MPPSMSIANVVLVYLDFIFFVNLVLKPFRPLYFALSTEVLVIFFDQLRYHMRRSAVIGTRLCPSASSVDRCPMNAALSGVSERLLRDCSLREV